MITGLHKNRAGRIAFWFLFLVFASPNVFSQTVQTIQGKITSDAGEALPGVSILLKGTSKGTTTDVDGHYSLALPDRNSTLVVSFIGYLSQELAVGGRSQLDIKLITDSKSLNEIVVVGYAEQSRAKTTASVTKLDAKELRNIPSTSPIQALQGKMAGVSVPVLTGQPGASASIVIRGGTTLNPYGTGSASGGGREVQTREESGPLVIVDGVFRRFNDVNPDDIESLQVLKDAASTAVYGARGANGVIVIKTKSGKGSTGKANVTFRYQHGFETQARRYNYLNARDYLVLARKTWARGIDNFDINQRLYVAGNSATVPTYTAAGQYGFAKWTPAYVNNLVAVEGQPYVDNLMKNGWQTIDDPVNPGNSIIFRDTQYQDVLWNMAQTKNYNVSVDGGTERANYNLSFGYVDQGGVFLGTGYKRFSGLLNTGYKVSDKFRLDLNMSYLWNDNKYIDNSQATLTRSTRIPDLLRLYNDDGKPQFGENLTVRNRLHELYYQDRKANTDQTTIRVAGDYEIIPGLHYRPSASIYFDNSQNLYFERFFAQQARPRDKSEALNNNRQIMTDHILQFDRTFATRHNLTVLAGFNFTRNTYLNLTGAGQRSATDYLFTFTGDPISTIINGTVQPNQSVSSSLNESKTASYFGQVNYDFDGKYLVGATLRYDGFSNFAPNNQYALFPSVSAGWNLHREDFWKVPFVNQFKIRGSYGQSGLNSLGYTDTYGGYGSTAYATGAGILRSNLANPNLLWETTETIDGGVDIGLFNGRVNLLVDVYNKLTRNRLDNLPLPAESGFNSIKYNVGQLRNRGLEVELNATVLKAGKFAWNTNFSFAFNRTTVVKLPTNGRVNNRINGGLVFDPASGKEIEVGGYAEGERPLGLWAWQSNGIFATDEAAKGAPNDLQVTAGILNKPKNGGDVNWADLNGDKIIDNKDLVFMGYRVPDKIGGMQNTFSFKGLTLRFTMDYAMGHVISNGALARAMGQGRAFNEGAPAEALGPDAWMNSGDAGKLYPRFSMGDADVGYKNHLRFVTGYTGVGLDDSYGVDNSIYYSKGDFLAFRELSLSYQVPQLISRKISAGSIQLNAGVYNLGYLTGYKGLNPEVYKGFDEGSYPRPRQFTLGATIRF